MTREYEEYERAEEFKALGDNAKANLRAILETQSADSISDLARYAYKYTDCGAALGALLYRGENPGKWVYGSDLRDLPVDEFITALSVSSIVEGAEQTTQTHIIDLFDDKYETPDQCAQAYSAALQAVEDEADEIWKQTHGCPMCAKHWNYCSEFGTIEGDDGITPIWDECPECGGEGSII